MGKIRTRVIGLEEVEKEQKQEQKKRAEEKKVLKQAKDETQENKSEQEVAEPKKEKKAKKNIEKSVKTRSRGRNYRAAKDKIVKDKTYTLSEAVALLKELKYAQFDESVELHMNTTQEGLRGEISLPHSIGKTVRVAIVDDALLEKLADNKIEFDILISHPSYMPKLARFAKVLGPRGLMPNPKTGTISPKPEEVAKKFEGGLMKWKGEAKFPLVHQMVGKISADSKVIEENVQAFVKAVGEANIKEIFIKTTMSPAVRITV